MIASVLFGVAAAMAIVGAFGAALVRNLFHASLLLGLCLLGVAGLYLFLEQHWLACVQVIVYVGGILVLILFATLFSADVMGAVQRRSRTMFVAGGIVAALAATAAWRLAVAGRAAADGRERATLPRPDHLDGEGFAVGDLLMGDWFVAFFAAGLLLTVALIGAVVVVQRFRRPAGEVADA